MKTSPKPRLQTNIRWSDKEWKRILRIQRIVQRKTGKPLTVPAALRHILLYEQHLTQQTKP